MTKFSYKIICSLSLQPYSQNHFLEMNFDKRQSLATKLVVA